MRAATISPPEAPNAAWRLHPSKLSVVKAVIRRMVPFLIEATLIPTALFYVFFLTFELKWAILAALCWTYAAVGRRLVVGGPVPGLLVLATLGISVRTAVFLFSHNDFVYFFQPILRTVATAAFFALSVVIGRPLVARFANDFCPLTADVQDRPAVIQLFRRLTYLWAGVNAVAAAAELDVAADGARRRVRRHGHAHGVDHHVQRRRADGVGLGPHGAQRGTRDGGVTERVAARLRHRTRSESSRRHAGGSPPVTRVVDELPARLDLLVE